MQVSCSGKGAGAGRPDQAMDSARLVSLRVACTGASIKHRSSRCSRCPQPLARLHVPLRKLVWARPDDDFPAAQANLRLPSRRCGSRSRVGLKHFRCPRQRSSTVSVRPTHLPDTPPPKAMAHQADFPCALSAVPAANLSRPGSFRECSETRCLHRKHRLGLQPQCQPRPQMDFACLPRNHGYPASVHPVAFSNARRGFAYSSAAAIMV